MATEIYLGKPPQYVIDWIKAHFVNPKTKITFIDGSVEEYNWSGEITRQKMIDAGLYDGDSNSWIKVPTTVEIGTNVTSIGGGAFGGCYGLTSVTIPDSVTSIVEWAFAGCMSLMSVTFSGKDKATVQGMEGYNWSLKSGCIIHCTDGDITI